MSRLNTHSDTDEIILWLQGESKKELSPKLQEKFERYETCRDLIRQHGSRHKVTRMLRNIYGKKIEGYSQATAYRDYEDTTLIFGSTPNYARGIWIDNLLGMMMETRKRAMNEGDFRSATTAEKNMLEVVLKLMGEPENDEYKNLQPVAVTLGFFPEELRKKIKLPSDDELKLEIQKLMKSKRKNNLTDSQIQDAEIVED